MISPLLRRIFTQHPASNEDVEDFLQVYGAFRDYIKTEDALINQRITWMLTIHGFLYATYGFTLQKILETNEKVAEYVSNHLCEPDRSASLIGNTALRMSVTQVLIFLVCVCVVGLVISITALTSTAAAYNAATAARNLFHQNKDYCAVGNTLAYEIVSGRNTVYIPYLTGGGYNTAEVRGYRAAWSIPTALIVGWFISLAVLGFEFYFQINFNLGPQQQCTAQNQKSVLPLKQSPTP